MTTPHTTTVRLQPETVAAIQKVPAGTIAAQAMSLGISNGEFLLVALNGCMEYARAYESRFGGDKLASDYILGPAWLQAATGLRELLNCDGSVALARGITTDSKDNGALESVFWSAMEAAGFGEGDI
jgi:hypothetical protein